MKSSKSVEFTGVYNASEQGLEVGPQTFRSTLGESEYQLRLAEKTNEINDARSDLAAALGDFTADSEEIGWLQERFDKAMDAACVWLITLDDLVAALGVNTIRIRLEGVIGEA